MFLVGNVGESVGEKLFGRWMSGCGSVQIDVKTSVGGNTTVVHTVGHCRTPFWQFPAAAPNDLRCHGVRGASASSLPG